MPLFTKTRPLTLPNAGANRVKEQESAETSEADAYRLQISAELWKAVIQEGSPPAEDTRAALQAIRAALDAARRLRFASTVSEDEQHRLAALAEESVVQQDCALRHWYMERSFGAFTAPAVPKTYTPPFLGRRLLGSGGILGLARRNKTGKAI